MTNAEYYLKEGISAIEFREKLAKYILNEYGDINEQDISEVIGDFLNNIEKPTLTEDERVILRNINKEFIVMGRKKDKDLYVNDKEADVFNAYFFTMYNHLFQFIKERRRILNWGVVKMTIPDYAYIKYLILTNCEIPQAKEEILRYIEELLKWTTEKKIKKLY